MMSIDDLDYNDLDDQVESQNEFDLLEWGIAIYRIDDPKKYIGSGFIIGSDGLFISVGHNFKHIETKGIESYRACFRDSVYEIEVLYMEYEESSGVDLFIGKLKDCKNEQPPYSLCSENELPNNTQSHFAGFISITKNLHLIKTIHIPNTNIYIHPNCDIETHIVTHEHWLDIDNNKYGSDLSNVKDFLRFIDLKNADDYHGFSGGPLFDRNIIYGVIASTYCISSVYISEKLQQLEYLKKGNPFY